MKEKVISQLLVLSDDPVSGVRSEAVLSIGKLNSFIPADMNKEIIEIRFFIGLPANGRKINSQVCKVMLFKELPEIIELALFPENLDISELEKHIKTAEDAEYIRSRLKPLNLAAFIADNSILPRRSSAP